MKNKMVWKLAASFAAVLLLFSIVLGAVFIMLFRQHTVTVTKEEMEKRAVSIANTIAALSLESAAENQEASSVHRNGRGMGRGMGVRQQSEKETAHEGKHEGESGHQRENEEAEENEGCLNMNGYGAYLRFLDELAMSDVWLVDDKLNLLTYGHNQSTSSYEKLPKAAEQIVKSVFEGKVAYEKEIGKEIGEEAGGELSGLLNAPSLTVGAPIMAEDGTVIGAVLLHSPVSGIDHAVRQGFSALAVGVGVALLFAAAASVWLACRFTRPLQKMRTAALHLAEGDYTAKTGVVQKDEIGQLAQTIDFLSGKLDETEQQRRTLDKMKEDFVANVSHELRTPVAVMKGSLEVLRDGTINDSDEVQEYYEQMLIESGHLERLINDLLDLSRLQDSGFKLDMGEVNLSDVVRDSARAARRTARQKEVIVTAECPDEECVVYGDYARIRQMLLILLDNAVKFSQENSEVSVRLQKEGQRCCIEVKDIGIEIPPDELPHIFDRFHKTRNVQNKKGTGLGLAIARQIADRHHATIHAVSQNGTTSFFICLPGS